MNRQVKVYIGDVKRLVGTLFFNASGHRESSGFEYSSEWIESGASFEIDPALPLQSGRAFRSKKEEGSVFHGAIADSEPDGWAKQVILRANRKERKEKKEHIDSVLTSLDFLLAVDDFSRIGALRFQDESGVFQQGGGKKKRTAPPLIELNALLRATRAVETDTETAADLEYLRGRGTSLGGLRPKCTVIDQDGSLSIGKFPSVRDSYPVTKGEVLALHIAAAAGIQAAEARIVESDGTAVALIKRFDRSQDGERIPYVSAATLLGIENSHQIHTYTEIVDALNRYSADFRSDAEELWRRIALTILITNVDDHLRNLGFLHVEKNQWRLSPAFDINPFPDRRRVLKTWISESTGDAASILSLMEAAPYFGIESRRAVALLSTVEKAVARWRQIGSSLGMKTSELNAFETAFEHEERLSARRIISHKQSEDSPQSHRGG
jgi:serine/threonine-protein kinase HipA